MKANSKKDILEKAFAPIHKWVDRLSLKTLDCIVIISVFLLTCIQLLYASNIFSLRYLWLYIPSCILIGFILLAGLKKNIHITRVQPMALICWSIITLFIGINGFFINTDDLSEFLIWLIVFPFFYLIWHNQYARLFPLIAKGVCLSFIPFLLISLAFYPIQGSGYTSLFQNPNGAAMYLTAVYICMLMLLFASKNYIFSSLCYGLGLALVGTFIFFTNSRGGILASLIPTVTIIIILLIRRYKWYTIFLKIIGSTLALIVFIFNLVPISHYCYSILPSGTLIDISEMRPSDDITDEIIQSGSDRFSGQPSDLNEFSTGRIDLWLSYSKEIDLLGHSPNDLVYNSQGDIELRSSHLTQLQFAYQYGILAGIAILILHIFSGIKAIVFSLKEKSSIYSIFPLIIVLGYGAYSLFEANITTFGRIIVLLYYMAIIPLFCKPSKKISTIKPE